jgi:hypothetical protein
MLVASQVPDVVGEDDAQERQSPAGLLAVNSE